MRAVAANEADGLVGEGVGEVAAIVGEDGAVAVEGPLPVVVVDEGGGLVEAAGGGVVGGLAPAEMPFAAGAGAVAEGAKGVGEGAFAQREAVEPIEGEGIHDAGAVRVATGEQAGEGGGAERRGGVLLGQDNAFAGELVDEGRLGESALRKPRSP